MNTQTNIRSCCIGLRLLFSPRGYSQKNPYPMGPHIPILPIKGHSATFLETTVCALNQGICLLPCFMVVTSLQPHTLISLISIVQSPTRAKLFTQILALLRQ